MNVQYSYFQELICEILNQRVKTKQVVYESYYWQDAAKVFSNDPLETLSYKTANQKLLDFINALPHVRCWVGPNNTLYVEFCGLIK